MFRLFFVQADSYRTEILGNYENRVRAFSHPLKVFQYFASLGEYMSMEDFVRVICTHLVFNTIQ